MATSQTTLHAATDQDAKKGKFLRERSIIMGVMLFVALLCRGYQSIIAYMGGFDFICNGFVIMALLFAGMAVGMAILIDVLVHFEIISLTRWNVMTVGALVVSFGIQSVFLILEVGRINVLQNGLPLANHMAEEHEKAIGPKIAEIEDKLAEHLKLATIEDQANFLELIDSSKDIVAQGGKRPELEEALEKHGVAFVLPEKKGGSTAKADIYRQFFSIWTEQHKLYKEMQAAAEAKYKSEKNIPTAIRGQDEDAETIGTIRANLLTLKGLTLDPETYKQMVALQQKDADLLGVLVNKYHLSPPAMPHVRSLFVIALESATSWSTTSVVLWLTGSVSTIGGTLLLLITLAILRRRDEENGIIN